MSSPAAIKVALERNVKAVAARPSVGQGTAVTRSPWPGPACAIEEGPVAVHRRDDREVRRPTPGPIPASTAAPRSARASSLATRCGPPGSIFRCALSRNRGAGRYDVRGELGIDEAVRPGYSAIVYVVTVESDAPEPTSSASIDTADRYSSWRDDIRNPVPTRANSTSTRRVTVLTWTPDCSVASSDTGGTRPPPRTKSPGQRNSGPHRTRCWGWRRSPRASGCSTWRAAPAGDVPGRRRRRTVGAVAASTSRTIWWRRRRGRGRSLPRRSPPTHGRRGARVSDGGVRCRALRAGPDVRGRAAEGTARDAPRAPAGRPDRRRLWGARRNCGWAEIFPIRRTAHGQRRVPDVLCVRHRRHLCPAVFRAAGFTACTWSASRCRSSSRCRGRARSARRLHRRAGGPRLYPVRRGECDSANTEYLKSIETFRQGEAYHVPGEFVAVVGRA